MIEGHQQSIDPNYFFQAAKSIGRSKNSWYEKDLLNTVMHLVSVDGGYTWYDSEYFSMINTGPYPETRWIDYSPYGNEVLFTWIFYFN